MKTKQYPQLDVLKYIAALFVIVVHVYTVFENPYVNHFVVQVMGRITVPFFFSCSAFMVARRRKEPGYLMKYTKSLLITYFIFSLIYLPYGLHYVFQAVGFKLWLIPLIFLGGFFYVGTYYHLWFIPALLIALWLVDWCLKRMSYRQVIILGIGLFLFGALETYYFVLPSSIFHKVFDLLISLLYTTRNGIFFGLIFVAIGYQAFDEPISVHGWLAFLCFILFVIEAYYLLPKETLDFNFLLMQVPFTYCFFHFIVHWEHRIQRDTRKIRGYSTDYYFWHLVVLEFILFLKLPIPGYLIVVCTIVGTHYFSKIMNKLKIIEYFTLKITQLTNF